MLSVAQKGYLVGDFNPFEKYARQIGSFLQVGVKIKNLWNHHPDMQQASLQSVELSPPPDSVKTCFFFQIPTPSYI